jgi:type IV fimbrial biogenesis protein FimT
LVGCSRRRSPDTGDCAAMKSAQHGFTMVEMVVVMSIVGILMAFGAPSYKYVTTANRITGEINGLLGDLQFARSEAIKEGTTVTVCATTNGTTCTGAGSTWTTGWLVFMDGSTVGTLDGTDLMLRMQKPLSGGDTFTADSAVTAITFNREGFAQLPQALTLRLHNSPAVNQYTRCLAISIVGAMSTELSGAGNCT